MFGNNKKSENNAKELNGVDLKTRVDRDLLVRNMPSIPKSQSKSKQSNKYSQTNDNNSGSSFRLAPVSNQHQKIGFLIISGGIVLIGALIYLSYIFIIKPNLKSSVESTAPNNQLNINEPVASETDSIQEAPIDSPAAVTEAEPIVLEINNRFNDPFLAEENSSNEDILNQENISPLVDADDDGLNEDEEMILGTNPNSQDSNSNGYPDLLEIRNNYNPAGTGRLASSSLLSLYNDNVFNYQLIYPKDWEFNLLDNNRVLIFNTPDESLIQVTIQENSGKQSISDWHAIAFPDQTVTSDQVIIKPTWEGIEGADSLNIYLTDDSREYIYIFSYLPASANRLAYPNIFKMMLDSLMIIK